MQKSGRLAGTMWLAGGAGRRSFTLWCWPDAAAVVLEGQRAPRSGTIVTFMDLTFGHG